MGKRGMCSPKTAFVEVEYSIALFDEEDESAEAQKLIQKYAKFPVCNKRRPRFKKGDVNLFCAKIEDSYMGTVQEFHPMSNRKKFIVKDCAVFEIKYKDQNIKVDG